MGLLPIRLSYFRPTIERLRTLVLVAGLLLVAATVGFLAIGKWKNPFKTGDLPRRLGFNIQQESNGVTFSHALGGHSQFKVHASKVVQLKQGNALLHDVEIELYGEDGSRVDRIQGGEFEYDQKNGTAIARGPVQITLMRPGVAPALAPKAVPGQAQGGKDTPLNTAARAAAQGQVHVNTSGLNFNWNTGISTTTEHVDFSTAQGTGSSTGATYDSKAGHLELDRDVRLHARRSGEPVEIQAAHAEFTHDDMICELRSATVAYHNGQATAAQARIEFRPNGSATRLEATGGFEATTSNGGRIQAPHAVLEFNERNQPQHGRLDGSVTLDAQQPGRHTHGTAALANIEFNAKGELRHAHLEGGVTLDSDEEGHTPGAHPEPTRSHRNWRSPLVELEFRTTTAGKVEPATLVGTGGVTVTSRTERAKAAPATALLSASQVNGVFSPGGALSQLAGTGHAAMEQTLATGAHQTAHGDQLEAHFANPAEAAQKHGAQSPAASSQIETGTLDGHVVLTQQQPTQPGRQPQPPLHAFSGHAAYAADGQWLHLTAHPRIDDGGLQMTAEAIDISQDSGDAFAHGNVKATWLQTGNTSGAGGGLSPSPQEPAHVIAAEAQVHQTPGNTDSVATFRGHARLWQQASSVAAPVIVLEKNRQSLEAHSTDRAEPVRVVMLNQSSRAENRTDNRPPATASSTPSVVRLRGGDLHYSGIERTALMQAGSLGPVVAETPTATTQSDQVEVHLTPAATPQQGAPALSQPAQSQVDRLTARGHLTLNSQGRHGTGEQLVYTGATGEYVLTGTVAQPPRITDPSHGVVTGASLIFRSRDDSVSIEGGGRPTSTQTTAPR